MKKIWKYLIVGLLSLVLIVIATFFYLKHSENKKMEVNASELINKIEQYKQQFGKTPSTIAELGLQEIEEKGPYYEKLDSINYKVYFNIGFDNSYVYDSKSKKWENKP